MTRAAMGLPPDATEEEIRRRYKEQAQRLHPDKGGTVADFQRLQRAYGSAMTETREEQAAPVTCQACEGMGHYWMGSGFSRMRFTCTACLGTGQIEK